MRCDKGRPCPMWFEVEENKTKAIKYNKAIKYKCHVEIFVNLKSNKKHQESLTRNRK